MRSQHGEHEHIKIHFDDLELYAWSSVGGVCSLLWHAATQPVFEFGLKAIYDMYSSTVPYPQYQG